MNDARPAAGGLGLVFEQDVPIPMSDGNVLRCNVYRPDASGRFPVVMAQGVYAKDLHFEDGYKPQFDQLVSTWPDLCRNGSTGRYLRWETADPERWVPDGFVVVQVDSRGSGKSPGYLDPRSPREMVDYAEAIDWAGRQPWSNGRVGLLGISYLGVTQWRVATLQPKHLAAICPWEGFVDYYRDSTHHGGILSSGFAARWWPKQCVTVQHGNGDCPYRDRLTGKNVTGPDVLTPAQLAANRTDYPADILRHNLDDAWWRERTPDLSRIEVPLLSAGNWGSPAMHLRGNVEGFMGAASRDKWLSLHVGKHWGSFYMPEYIAMQKRFLGHFLRGDDNGWEREPRVRMVVRDPRGNGERTADGFPPPEARPVPYFLDASSTSLSTAAPGDEARTSYAARGPGVSFSTAPFARDTEFCGFVRARLWIASSTGDMDIFATLRIFDPAGDEVMIEGSHETFTPVSRGWLRASQRKLDPARTTDWRPFHAHDETQQLEPGRPYEVDVEIWPTSMVYPAGYRLVLTLMGEDFQFPDLPGRFLHDHPEDRGGPDFHGTCTILTGGGFPSCLIMPEIVGRE